MVMLGTDMKVADTPKTGLKDYAKADPYADWLKAEGVTVHQEFYFPSLAKVELGPWERKAALARSPISITATCLMTAILSRSNQAANPSRSITCTSSRSMWFRAVAQRRSGKMRRTRSASRVLNGTPEVFFPYRSTPGTRTSTAAATSLRAT